jgi:hypothetical protein
MMVPEYAGDLRDISAQVEELHADVDRLRIPLNELVSRPPYSPAEAPNHIPALRDLRREIVDLSADMELIYKIWGAVEELDVCCDSLEIDIPEPKPVVCTYPDSVVFRRNGYRGRLAWPAPKA